nr:zinc finger BED domain-containing protein DAYSLEEPER-like [Tanacetum cinerariifolium]
MILGSLKKSNNQILEYLKPEEQDTRYYHVRFKHSSVTYTSVPSSVTYTSVPSLDSDYSDIGSPEVDGPPSSNYVPSLEEPEQPPLSPNYMPGLEEPEQPPLSPDYVPGPEEPEQAPPSPVYLPYVPDLVYPKYIPPEDNVFPTKEQSLPVFDTPTTDSPGHILKFDPKGDPEEDDGEDPCEDPANSTVVSLPAVDHVPFEEPTKRGRKNSMVWEDFTTKDVGDGETRAVCMICKKDFAYIKGSTNSGTSHLKRHLEHHKGPSKISVQAMGPIKDTPRRCKKYTPQRGSKTASVPVAFDSERYRHEIARMIILHDYPLHRVEHKGFMTFLHNLQPMFNMVDFNTIQHDCVAIYLRERSTIKNLIARMPGQICLTLDVWNSNNTTGYVFITGKFIDSEWKIHKRLLNVMMELYPESKF